MLNADVTRATNADESEQEHYMALTALMVHVDIDHASDQQSSSRSFTGQAP
jgi:hypothetical protein